MTYKPPAYPAGLRPWAWKPSAKGLQKALKAAGYMRKGVTLSDVYGPLTQAGVRSFHKANPQYGVPSDGAIGPRGWAHLHEEAYGVTVERAPGEPVHDYGRVTYGGMTVNKRTRTLLIRAEVKLGGKFTLSQGSYSTGVSASAGTHDGGGTVDISVSGLSAKTRLEAVTALRTVGFAAWLRTPAEGFSYHIHAVAIGDREASASAVKQVVQYFEGKNGLRGHGPDSAPASVGRPIPEWAERYRP